MTFQFTISLIMIICTWVVYIQIGYVHNKDLECHETNYRHGRHADKMIMPPDAEAHEYAGIEEPDERVCIMSVMCSVSCVVCCVLCIVCMCSCMCLCVFVRVKYSVRDVCCGLCVACCVLYLPCLRRPLVLHGTFLTCSKSKHSVLLNCCCP